MTLKRLILPLILLTALTAWAFQAATHALRPKAPATLAQLVPQGALLTIESPDFAALLQQWSASPECAAWVKSSNYSVFSNSRLFGRLSDAQTEFDAVAFKDDAPEPNAFLTQIAGKQSILAWYDVGALEFLYITRMSSQQSLTTALLKEKSHFQQRQAAGHTFYVRTSKDSPTRTVAFATVANPGGDLLLLATREDLLAQSLTLIGGAGDSVIAEPWYQDATAALKPGPQPPALHMILNLDRIVPLPQFNTYWVQQNITQMRQYRAAATDLYLGPTFREERALLLKSPDLSADPDPDLATLAAHAPPTSIFRAVATHDPQQAIGALEEKLLGRPQAAGVQPKNAPDPSLATPQAGDTTDLETRIDTPAPVSATFSNQALADALKAAALDSYLTVAAAQLPTQPTSLWVPQHAAVVLHGASPFNPQTLQSALQQSLRGTLTTGTLGIDFRPGTAAGHPIYILTGPKPLYLAVDGDLAILSDDQPLLESLLATPTAQPTPATLIAGFDHTAQRPPYARLTGLIDGTNATTPAADTTPAFFSQNLGSLSQSFAALQSQRIVERHEGANLHQTVTYQWQP